MKLKAFLNLVVTLVIFLIMGFVLYRNINQLRAYEFSLNWISLGFSFLFFWVFLILYAYGWRSIMKECGYSIGHRKLLHIKLVSDIARFLPGKIWYFARRAQMAKKVGIPYGITVYSVLLEVILGVVAATLLFLVSFLYIGKALPSYAALIVFVVLVGYLIFNPKTLTWIINKGLKKFGRKTMNINIKFKSIIKITSFFIIIFAFLGIAFYFMANAVYPIGITKLPLVAAIFLGSWVIGYFGIITPGGLGVREGALSFLLALFMPISIAIIISILSRVWWIVGELVLVLFFIKDKEERKRI